MSDLIYFTVGYNIEYLKLFEMCYTSLIDSGGYSGDTLLYLSDDQAFINMFYSMRFPGKERIKLSPFRCRSMVDSAVEKLYISVDPYINKYSRVVFIDCDILVINKISSLLDIIGEDILVGNDDPRYLMTHELWGGSLLDSDDRIFVETRKIPGLNSGVFCFNVTDRNRVTLKMAYNIVLSNPVAANVCLEQPAFNYALLKNENYDLGLQPYIQYRGHPYNFSNIDMSTFTALQKSGVVLLHFCGGPGNFVMKREEMNRVKNLYANIKY